MTFWCRTVIDLARSLVDKHPPLKIGLTITVGWVSSAIGGWLGGILADRIGRVRALQIAVLWFAGGTLLCAITQNFEQLLAARVVFGLGFGGEWAIGAALIGEVAMPKHRGTTAGVVHGAWSVGWAIAALLYPLTYALFPETMAWRVLFAVGFLPALFVFYIRRFVDESPIYLEQRRRAAMDGWATFLEIFQPQYLRNTILAAVVSTEFTAAPSLSRGLAADLPQDLCGNLGAQHQRLPHGLHHLDLRRLRAGRLSVRPNRTPLELHPIRCRRGGAGGALHLTCRFYHNSDAFPCIRLTGFARLWRMSAR